MAVTLPDEAAAWADRLQRSINDREAFAAAAAGFAATFRFEILPDDAYPGDPVAVTVVVDDGACTAARAGRDGDYDFALCGPYAAWRDLLDGELSATAAVMDGPLDVEGSTIRLMQRREAIGELLDAARAVDAEFAY